MKKTGRSDSRPIPNPLVAGSSPEQTLSPQRGAREMRVGPGARGAGRKMRGGLVSQGGEKDRRHRVRRRKNTGKMPTPREKAPNRGIGFQPVNRMGTARGRVKSATPDAQRSRAQMLRRLATLRELVWRQFKHAPLKAIDRALKIEEREAALLGLDFPRRHQVVNYDASGKISVAGLREHLWRAHPEAQPAPAPLLGPGAGAADAQEPAHVAPGRQ